MKYDYIFTGVGLASLLVLHEMMESDLLQGKKILLLESNDNYSNDKTWCFWENEIGNWDAVVSHKWSRAFFLSSKVTINCMLDGNYYKMIESSSFYTSVLNRLKLQEGIVWKKEKVISFEEKHDEAIVLTEKETYTGTILFNSIFDFSKLKNNKRYPLLQQHFVGWFVKVSNPFFDADCATFMDFTIPQNGNTRFMYVLPLSSTEALIEYTLFSEDVLQTDEYDASIEEYLKEKGIEDFEVFKKEKGNIPMTAYPFWKHNSKCILNIGTAGGWTKASSGYTFQNSVKQSKRVAQVLNNDLVDFTKFYKRNRFWIYDILFLDVLHTKNELGSTLFSGLFSKVNPSSVLRFLDEKSTWSEDLKIIMACPKKPFLKALIKRVYLFLVVKK